MGRGNSRRAPGEAKKGGEGPDLDPRPGILGPGLPAAWIPLHHLHRRDPHTNFSELENFRPPFHKQIGTSLWMCFETTHTDYMAHFWKDNPYQMLGKLGCSFHTRENDYSVGLHFDAYPPDFDPKLRPTMQFWISVTRE